MKYVCNRASHKTNDSRSDGHLRVAAGEMRNIHFKRRHAFLGNAIMIDTSFNETKYFRLRLCESECECSVSFRMLPYYFLKALSRMIWSDSVGLWEPKTSYFPCIILVMRHFLNKCRFRRWEGSNASTDLWIMMIYAVSSISSYEY